MDPVTLEMVALGAVRVAGALPVLRWPLAGSLIAIAVDLSDLLLMNLVDQGGLGDYQHWDKAMDAVYMATFLVSARRHFGRHEFRVAAGLFALRLVGVAIYLAAGTREVLLAVPNVFEFWFLFVAARDRLAPAYALTARRTAGWLLALLGLKLLQEYVIHGWRVLDSYNALDLLRSAGRWLRPR
jgi:hypothetical protein